MGRRTAPGSDHGTPLPSRREVRRQEELTRSGRREAAAEPPGGTETDTVAERPSRPAADRRPRTRPVAGAPAVEALARSRPARPSRAARPARSVPVARQRGALTELIDEAHLAGPSDLEVDVTPEDLAADLDVETPDTAGQDDAPRSRREARVRAAAGTKSRPAPRTSSRGGSRRPPVLPVLPVNGRWRPQNRKVWGAAIATALVLLVPGTTLLSPSDPIVEGTLNSANGNLYGTLPTNDATTQDALVPTEKPKDQQKEKSLRKAAPAKSATRSASSAEGTGEGSGDATGSGGAQPSATKKAEPSATKKAEPAETEKAEPEAEPKSEPRRPTSDAGSFVGTSSNLGWSSGAFIPGDSASKLQQFANWRGRGVDAAITYTARENWTDTTTGFDWLLNSWKGTNKLVVIGVPPFPEKVGASLGGCASGEYNDKWQTFARTMKASGIADRTVIRLGWEFNGSWYKWSAEGGQGATFAKCWRQVVGTVESIVPALRWDWNVNRGVTDGLADPTTAWPGNDYVDIVGVDSYDWYPGVRNQDDWSKHKSGTQGLDYWLDFARQHGKKISFPEWGLYSANGYSGGDNPYYIKRMMAYFKSIQGDLAYESYFNEDMEYIRGSIFGDVQNPSAAEAYREVYTAG